MKIVNYFLEKVIYKKGTHFHIPCDRAAIEAANEEALRRGIGYDPNYKPKDLRELIELKKLADIAIELRKKENFNPDPENICSENDFIRWIEENITGGRKLEDLTKEIESAPKRHSNFVTYVFGSDRSKLEGMLYWELSEIYKLEKRQEQKHEKNISIDEPIKSSKAKEDGKNNYKVLPDSNAQSAEKDLISKDMINKLLEKLPDQRGEIFQLYYREGYKQAEIFRKLGISRQAVHRHINQLKQMKRVKDILEIMKNSK